MVLYFDFAGSFDLLRHFIDLRNARIENINRSVRITDHPTGSGVKIFGFSTPSVLPIGTPTPTGTLVPFLTGDHHD